MPVLREALIESQGGKNTNTGPLADIFVTGAFIGVLKPAPTAINRTGVANVRLGQKRTFGELHREVAALKIDRQAIERRYRLPLPRFIWGMSDQSMSNFYVRGVLANLITLVILLACLFIPAGTLNYWQAWVFVAVFEVSAQALGIYFLVHDRQLVERRMNIGPAAEQRPAQKLISAFFILGFVGFVVLPAFDHRFGWSPVGPTESVIANAMIVLSFLLFFVVMKSNSYAASTIQVEEGQPVVSTGPYGYVRHPMYSGALLLLGAMPLALGSWWSVLLVVPFFPVLVWRILDEESFLRKNLPGYAEYMQRVRYRLVPRVW